MGCDKTVEARSVTLLGEILEGQDLTDREVDVLSWTMEGLTADEIGEKLHLSSETVKGYRKRVIAKMGARNSVHAVVLAFRRGMVS